MRDDTVPLPEPGAPMITARSSLADAPMADTEAQATRTAGLRPGLRAPGLRSPGRPAGWLAALQAGGGPGSLVDLLKELLVLGFISALLFYVSSVLIFISFLPFTCV